MISVEKPCFAEPPSHVGQIPGCPHIDESGKRDEAPAQTARLHPKEHGAYAILAIPLVASLFIVGLTPATILITTAAVAAFLAHEPLLIVCGHRGNRARESTPYAIRALFVRLTMVVVCGASAFWLGGPVARLGLVVCIALASVELVISTGGYCRTLAAQMLGIAGLTLPGTVVLLAGGVELAVAAQFWLLWFAGRIATTASVRSVIMRHKSSASAWATRCCDVLLATAFTVCAVGLSAGQSIWIVTLPLLLAAGALRVLSPHPRHLKQIGWNLLVVNVVSGIMAVGFWNY